ncbi:TRAP transporter substrate-binding protein DctP [Zhihengliuella flava]|uniref:Tripartite ATP-independent transporter DctP family solute receptor n=1 Tax=Zhihengliuella flava TaxID=1285193 RepID=A0A931GIR4_9MICC|nr:TRAP transporter substrate-binding protein DctP [Zhihengliuella flava]MBG6084546.1 tripartite ATP-independent transporter DctP family solute receptor [Zhihengliuella flava]
MKTPRIALATAALLPIGLLTACGSGNDDGTHELTLAHSYTQDQPAHTCGAMTIKEEVERADVGLTVEIYDSSQLGGDADRIASVLSGDIDIDLQGASALATVYEPIGVVDAAYAFEDGAHVSEFFRSTSSDALKAGFKERSGINVLGAWSVGPRHFTANTPIRTPEDLEGLRIRFPGSLQFLMNAKALGANATEVAYEEVYLSMQQGLVDGGENTLSNIAATNMDEVQDYVSLSEHQENSNLLVMGDVFDELSSEQRDTLLEAVRTAEDAMIECVATTDAELVEEFDAQEGFEVVDDVDIDAFRERSDEWFRQNLTGDSLTAYESIKDSRP